MNPLWIKLTVSAPMAAAVLLLGAVRAWSPEVLEVLALAAALFGLVAAILGLTNARRIKEVHVIINSRLDSLLTLTAKSSKAVGVLEEKQRQGDENAVVAQALLKDHGKA